MFVAVLRGVYVRSKQWYVIYSKPRKEKEAQFHLSRKGIESFFPRLHLPGRAGEGSRKIVPLFPNYLFVRLNIETQIHYVAWTPGVKRIVSFTNVPLPMEERIVHFLRDNADSEGIITARSRLERGQAVEISAGPFNGLAAIIQDPPDAKGRVKVLLKLMSRHISVQLGIDSLNAGSVSYAPVLSGNIRAGSLLAV